MIHGAVKKPNLLGIVRNGVLGFGNNLHGRVVEAFDHELKIHVISTFHFATIIGNSAMFFKSNETNRSIHSSLLSL